MLRVDRRRIAGESEGQVILQRLVPVEFSFADQASHFHREDRLGQ